MSDFMWGVVVGTVIEAVWASLVIYATLRRPQ